MAEIFLNGFRSETLNGQGQFAASNTFSMITSVIVLKVAQSLPSALPLPYPSALPLPPARSKLRSKSTDQTAKSSPAATTEHD